MADQLFLNNATTTIRGSLSTTATSIVVNDTIPFPTSLTNGDWFIATLDGGGNYFEIVRVTAVAGNVWTVVRAQENTTAKLWQPGSRIECRVTAGSLELVSNSSLQSNLANTSDVTKGDAMIGVKQPFTGAVAQTQHQINAERISVTNFGAATGNTSAQNIAAFLAAEAATDQPIYVPDGTFQLTTPMALGHNRKYYGPGVLRFDNAEWFRAGGSAGTAPTERFTLFYEYASQSDVYCNVDGVPQTLTWINNTTFEVAAPAAGTAVNYGIVNGTLALGPEPEFVRAYNVFANGGGDIVPSMGPSPSYATLGVNNVAIGSRALQNITTASNNVAVGSRALISSTTGGNNTAIGFQALYRNTGTGNTAIGSVAGEWNVSGNENVFVGLHAGSKNVSGSQNTAVGEGALGESAAASFATAIGHRAMGNSGEAFDIGNNTCVGAFSGDFTRAQNNTFVGYRAGCGPNTGSDGTNNVAVGFFALRNQDGADSSVAIGSGALAALTTGNNSVAVGFEALNAVTGVGSQVAIGYQALRQNTTGDTNTAIGESSLTANLTGSGNTAVGFATLPTSTTSENTVVGSRAGNALTTGSGLTAIGFEAGRFVSTTSGGTFVGHRAGRSSTGADNTSCGYDALQLNTTGIQNTALGRSSLRLDQSGANQTAFDNTTGIGYDSRVSASNQVQLGNSATTTYVYGTVQNRSDLRDKTDVRDTVLGLGFIEALRPVDYKWDMRDDYISSDDDGNVTRLPKDGSKARTRFHHGLIAQEVKAVIDESGIDFGGFQDHTVQGGCDVMTIGYDELIAPLIKAVQELSARVKELESKQ